MSDFIVRFFVGGLVVSFFAMLGDTLRPKSFAGLFSAAPSIALATLALTIHRCGKGFAAEEAMTMQLGAIAFFVYCVLVCFILRRFRPSVLIASFAVLPIWFAISVGSWIVFSGRW